MEFANTITIERSVHDVFQFLADFENVPKWNYAIVETRKTSHGQVGVGATYHQLRSVPAGSEEEFEVTEFELDQRLAISGTLGPVEGTVTYELQPFGAGTRLTNWADLHGRGLAKLAAPLAAGRIREAVAANLAKLKELLES
jgi:uncharacterized protein YndB with AHSA1/START domain